MPKHRAPAATTRIDDVSRQLRAIVDKSHEPYLPTVANLAKALRCDTHAIVAAAAKLRNEGVLSHSRGRRMRILHIPPPLPPVETARLVAAPERLFRELVEAIRSGSYPPGQPLPKRQYFALEKGLSPLTVGKAYALLVEHKLAHRQGRRWVVGGFALHAGTEEGRKPVVLLLQPKNRFWSGLDTKRTRKFIITFMQEARTAGVRLLPCTLYSKGLPEVSYATGLREILELAKKLDFRYLGAILVGDLAMIPDFDPLLGHLTALERPVVWFDRKDYPEYRPIRRKYFMRCRFDEEAFAFAGMEHLLSLGHRRMAYVYYLGRSFEWIATRQAALERCAAAMDVTLYTAIQAKESILHAGEGHLETILTERFHEGGLGSLTVAFLEALRKKGRFPWTNKAPVLAQEKAPNFRRLARATAQWLRPPHSRLLGILPDTIPCLLMPGVTAIIASDDETAIRLYQNLRAMGLHVPEDVSMVSYDNYWDLASLAVTTVELGAAELGYRAFHAILGDIPVPVDGNGEIVARPALDHRGSVARVSK